MGPSIAKVDIVVATKPAEKAETLRAPAALLQSLSQVTEIPAKNSRGYIPSGASTALCKDGRINKADPY